MTEPGKEALVVRLLGLTTGEGLRAQLLRGGLGSLAVKLGGTALALLSSVVLARVLGADGYGVYAYVSALVSLFVIPVQFGLPNLVVRETAKAEAEGRWGLMRGLWRWSTVVTVSAALALALVMALLARALGQGFTEAERATFLWGLVLIPLLVLISMHAVSLRGLLRVVAGQLPEAILRPAFLILLILGALFVWPSSVRGPEDAMAVHVIAAAIAALAAIWLLHRHRPAALKQDPTPRYYPRIWLRAALPMAFIAFMQVVNKQADVLILGLFAAAEDVGVYRVVVRGGTLIVFGLQAINMAVAPHFSRLYSQRKIERLQKLVTVTARASFILGLPIAAVFFVWGEAILATVFGAEFARGYTALAIIAMGQVVSAGMGAVAILLNMTGFAGDTARGMAVAAALNVVMNLILIPAFGMTGAAMATALTIAGMNIFLYRTVRRRLGVRSSPL